MKYMAYVEKIDELIEEAVTININGVVFTGFSTVCPYKIEEGKIILLFSTLQFLMILK